MGESGSDCVGTFQCILMVDGGDQEELNEFLYGQFYGSRPGSGRHCRGLFLSILMVDDGEREELQGYLSVNFNGRRRGAGGIARVPFRQF